VSLSKLIAIKFNINSNFIRRIFMSLDPIVITGYARTALGKFQGAFSGITAPELGAAAIKAAFERSHLSASQIDETIMGCVLSAGLGQAPARQASLGALLPQSCGATTINKMCGSGLKAVMLAHDAILAGSAKIVMAGGLENMSRAPYLLEKAREGYRLGHGKCLDHLFLDGLEDAYDKGRLMGTFADDTAKHYGFTREAQDAFAIESLTRAQAAISDGSFQKEITPFIIKTRKDDLIIQEDEIPPTARFEKIPQLKPAFNKDGTVTAANASSIADGAAALCIMRESTAKTLKSPISARIIGHSTCAKAPAEFTIAPVGAIKMLLEKIKWDINTVDLFEINEAFAVVTMAAMRDLKLDPKKVNIHGGACALGHPIGASGARILVTLLAALEQYDLKRGIASLCIGGGEAVAIAVER
jgi:acetyl-CoA C-acetyltransferase